MANAGFVHWLIPLVIVVIVLLVLRWLTPVKLFTAAWTAGAPISFAQLAAMRMRGIPPGKVVEPLIAATKAGIRVNLDDLEAHHLAGGDVSRLVKALIAADLANLDLDFDRAAAIDLAGRDVYEAVKSATVARDVETRRIEATTRDGTELTAFARMTLRTNLSQLVGGATEETLIERVRKALRDALSSLTDHETALDDPKVVARAILDEELDNGTSVEILTLNVVIRRAS